MTSEPLNVLKRDLASLKRHIFAKKDHLTTCLKNKQPISEEDEAWLDTGAGNTVDKDRVLDFLENTSVSRSSPHKTYFVETQQRRN